MLSTQEICLIWLFCLIDIYMGIVFGNRNEFVKWKFLDGWHWWLRSELEIGLSTFFVWKVVIVGDFVVCASHAWFHIGLLYKNEMAVLFSWSQNVCGPMLPSRTVHHDVFSHLYKVPKLIVLGNDSKSTLLSYRGCTWGSTLGIEMRLTTDFPLTNGCHL